MSKHRRPAEPPDPAPEYRDWIDHRYTPGYFVGGRLSPWPPPTICSGGYDQVPAEAATHDCFGRYFTDTTRARSIVH